MMINLSILISLGVLFYFLGKAADLTVLNIKRIAGKLNVKIFFLGLILGFFTSLPELAVGINALVNDIGEISLGNLLGGVVVLFGFVLGLSIILNRKISTDGQIKNFLPVVLFLFLPLLLGLNGRLSVIDGIILICLYFLLLYHQYLQYRDTNHAQLEEPAKNRVFKKFLYIIAGLVFIILISNLIIRFTLILLKNFEIPYFIIGLLLFAIGTNLPEIIITVRSWKQKLKSLSFSNLIGSALANIFIIGIFSFIKPITFGVDWYYYTLMIFVAILFIVLLIFYKTRERLSRWEGVALLGIYFMFLATQIFLTLCMR